MTVERRQLLFASAATGLGLAAASQAHATQARGISGTDGLERFGPSPSGDVTVRLQQAIDRAAALRKPLHISPGDYDISGVLQLRSGTKLVGPYGLATLNLKGRATITAIGASDVVVAGLNVSGGDSRLFGEQTSLVSFNQCANLTFSDVVIEDAPVDALKLWRCSGRVERCRFERIGHTAITSGNAVAGFDISHNLVRFAGNNGIVIWRDAKASDGTIVSHNHVSAVRTVSGGTGQNGNGINVFRAGNVVVSTNTIQDCAYSAVRCNSASNTQIIGNNCQKLGEVALYAEFGFEGAVIANNIVDGAASGIVVTNFSDGGRLATVQGNIIRNLERREHEAVDKRGVGISVEADTVVNANTIENAPTAGIAIGWGPWLRQVAVSGNLIRDVAVGVAVSAKGKQGSVLISGNVISATKRGGVRLADYDKLVGEELRETNAMASPAILSGNLVS